MNEENFVGRKGKIAYLKEQQRKLKGLPVKQQQSAHINNVRMTVNKRLRIKPKEMTGIARKAIPINREKIEKLKSQALELKKSAQKKIGKINKRMFPY